MKFNLFIICLLLSVNINAQFVLYTYPDDEEKPPVRIDARCKTDSCLYYGGNAWNTNDERLFVTCIDSTAHVKWEITFPDTAIPHRSVTALAAFDSSLYCFILTYSTQPYFSKLNANDGSVIWTTYLNLSHSSDPKIFDYDSNNIFVGAIDSYCFIDKTTGVVTETYNYNQSSAGITLMDVDDSGYVYLGVQNSLKKFDRIDHDSILWSVQLSGSPIFADGVYIYQDSSFVYYIDGDAFKIIKLNCNDGSIASISNPGNVGDILVSELIDKNGYLYLGLRHRYVGSISSANTYAKFNKATDSIVWCKYIPINPLPIGPPPDDNIGCMGIDVDNSGNIFGTGYYNTSNYFDGTWYTFKADGVNGNTIWQHTIIDDSSTYDRACTGITAWSKNNKVYFLGLYNNDQSCYVTEAVGAIAKCDPTTGQIDTIYFDGGNIKFPAKVVSQKLLSNGEVISFIQRGRALELIKYDNNMIPVWDKLIYTKEYSTEILVASKMSIADNGNIAISSFMFDDYDYAHNQAPDSISIFELDSGGNLLRRTSMANTQNIYSLEDFLYDGTMSFIFYNVSSTHYCFKVMNGFFLPAFQFFLTVTGNSKHLADNISSTELVHYSTINGKQCLNRYDKINGSTVTDTTNVAVTDIKYLGNNKIMLSGGKLGSSVVEIYDFNTHDTVWTFKDSVTTSLIDLFIIDSLSNSVYGAYTNNELGLYKLDLQTGHLAWRQTFPIEQPGWQSKIEDLAYDHFNQRAICVGSTPVDSVVTGAIWIFDDSGNFIDTIFGKVKQGEELESSNSIERIAQTSANMLSPSNYFAEATSIVVPNDQMVIVAGTQFMNQAKAGMVYNFPPSVIINSPERNAASGLLCFPNPFHDNFSVRISNDVRRIEIIDLDGRIIKEIEDVHGQTQIHFYLQEYPEGVYLIRLYENEKVLQGKIIKM